MSTVYDWLTVLMFMFIVGLYFHRQQRAEQNLLLYLAAAAGCAGANYLGNEQFHMAALGMIAVTLLFVYWFILGAPGSKDGPS